MTIDCPQGWKSVAKVGPLTWEKSSVEIFGGVCNSCDLCGIRTCQFFDETPQGTRRFKEALIESHATIEGLIADQERQHRYRRRKLN